MSELTTGRITSARHRAYAFVQLDRVSPRFGTGQTRTPPIVRIPWADLERDDD